MSPSPLTIVGIGADGWAGLGDEARAAIRAARLLIGSARQLDGVPAGEIADAERRPWPSPIDAVVDELSRSTAADERTVVLASGDPMLHGIGATLAQRRATELDTLRVLPHPSAFALACARLGWPAAEVELLSAVARPPQIVARALQPGRRLVVYVAGVDGAATLARLLRDRGWGPSRFALLEQLGGPAERVHESTADAFGDRDADPLHAVAIECRSAAGVRPLARTPGLPDDAYAHDGQLTKSAVRAVTLAALAPAPGQLLWDVGAGSGSIGIEWLRAEPTARAVAIEPHPERAARVAANASTLGVPQLTVVEGRAPDKLDLLDRPDAIFVGGGLTASPDLLDRCWDALAPGGRIVANAVTLEGEQVLQAARCAHGGTLTRIAIGHAEPVGRFTAWRDQLPVVQWSTHRPHEEPA
ncbi:MAG: cobalamin biosynthesis bifunctional protein CbiET [Conexibacter sp.]|nr:cobalamin biosynthesis bifunctional protein CbiET [Conexibacter sp.]